MSVAYTVFTDKHILKWNKELLELHKRVVTTYLVSLGLKLHTRKGFFILYDRDINESNIQSYFYTPIEALVKGIVLGRLDEVSTYIVKNGKRKRKSRTRKG
jgi:hypothetical protein